MEKVILISIDGMRPDGFLACGNPYIEELQRNYEPAPASPQQAAEKWPDEAEITAAIRRIKKIVKATK